MLLQVDSPPTDHPASQRCRARGRRARQPGAQPRRPGARGGSGGARQKLAAGPQGSTSPRTPRGRAAPAGFAYHQGTSQFKGVSWSERSRKWRAQLWFGAKVRRCRHRRLI